MIVAGHVPQPGAPPRVPRGCEWVYGRHLLWRTAAALLGRETLRLPEDIPRLVGDVYSDTALGPPEWQDALRDARARHLRQQQDREAQAQTIVLPDPARAALWEITSRDQGEAVEEASATVQSHVRLGAPTIEVLLLRGTAGAGSAWTVSHGDPVSVPLDRVPDEGEETAALGQAVRLPAQITEAADREAFRPQEWRVSPALSDTRVLLLPPDGSPSRLGGYDCSYSPETGLTVVTP